MTPPRWVDEHGQPCPTRPCPTCGRVIPVNRWPVQTLPTQKRWPYQVLSVVEWCEHQQEVVLVPEGDGWYAEIPVLWGWRGGNKGQVWPGSPATPEALDWCYDSP